ncbi:MAG TPA: hypothetical protein VF403_26330 [Kofleriaceae bacterium]
MIRADMTSSIISISLAGAVLLAVPACLVTTGGSKDGVDVTWTVERLSDGNTGCPESWMTARLVTADDQHPMGVSSDRFACSASRGHGSSVEWGAYTSWIEFLDRDDRVLAASIPQSVDVGAQAKPVASSVYVDAGYVELAWSWQGTRNCDATFDPFQEIELHLSNDTTNYTTAFSCGDTRGITQPIALGRYSVWVGQGFSGKNVGDVTIARPNEVSTVTTLL